MNCLSTWKIAAVLPICAVGLFLIARAAQAQQFSVTDWGHKDGLPSTSVYAITQTKDGYLWIGTGDGLIRFDGIQFVQPELPGIGTSLGQVTALESTGSAGLLIGTSSGRLVRWDGDFTVSTTLGSPIEHIQECENQVVQVEMPDRVIRLKEADLSTISSALSNGFKTDKSEPLEEESLHLGGESVIRRVLRNAGGAIWIATENEGLFRRAPGGEVQHFTRATGLPSDHIWDIFEDREGNIWAGTQNGLARLRQDKFITYTIRNGLLSDIATALASTSDNGVWIGSRSGLEQFTSPENPRTVLLNGIAVNNLLPLNDGKLLISTLTGIQELPLRKNGALHPILDMRVERMAQSEDGDLWLYGREAGLLHWRSGSRPEPINEPALAGQVVTSMQGGKHDQVWLGLENGDVILRPPAGSRIFTAANGLTGGAVRLLSSQPDGALWVASDRGLAYFDGERFRHWDRSSGLPGDRVIWTVQDARGNLWLGYSTGIARLNISDLLQPSSTTQQLRYDFYDDGDGLKSNPAAYGSSPIALTSDGRLWVSMSEGIGMIDLAHVHWNALPPPVHVLNLIADGRSLSPAAKTKIPAHTRALQIAYTAISFTEPRKVRFRYRLVGFENGWQDAGTRRSAFYTNLRPGHYRFQVIAANNDGVWNETGDSVAFELLPAFYQTTPFLILCALAIASLGYVGYRMRVRFAARELQSRYEARMAERTRIAQDLHDNLIQEMMGISLQLEIADAVTPGGAAAKGPLRRSLDLSRSALANGRNSLNILRQRPLSRSDFESTLGDTAWSLTGSREAVRFTSAGMERPIQPAAGEELLQIVREALRNAIQHAGPNEVSVRSEYGDQFLTFVVGDRGPGMSDELLRVGKPGHFGIHGMRERAARIGSSLTVNSSASAGTKWTLRVPAHVIYDAGNHAAHLSILRRYLRVLNGLLRGRDRS